ncbi:MAG: transposase [candidate division KSB1 bacterium]|nr:transposase [candidate division KSB1 bacterium]
MNVISGLFKKKFIAYLNEAWQENKIGFHGKIQCLKHANSFKLFKKKLYKKKWITVCKDVYRDPERVIDYPGRYTHRVAISNYRIESTTIEV